MYDVVWRFVSNAHLLEPVIVCYCFWYVYMVVVGYAMFYFSD